MDSFNIIWCTLWSDYFMVQHQRDTESGIFTAPVNLAEDFLFYFHNLLGEKKTGYYSSDEKTFVSVKLRHEEVEKITDWILNFNFSTRKPLGLIMPDLYLDEDKIRDTTVDVYCQIIAQFIGYLLENQSVGRDKIAKWAADNFMSFYANAYSEALRAKVAAQ